MKKSEKKYNYLMEIRCKTCKNNVKISINIINNNFVNIYKKIISMQIYERRKNNNSR